jgi:hypothetical protein
MASIWLNRHREERSDAAIQSHRRSLTFSWIASLLARNDGDML